MKEKEFYPCGQEGCQFYRPWEFHFEPGGYIIFIQTQGAVFPLCVTCEYFQKQNNFMAKG
jgi:hypothetical protein